MTSIFSRYEAEAQDAVDRVMSVPVEFIGMVSSDFSRAPDPNRPAVATRATPMLGGATSDNANARGGPGDMSQRSYMGSAIWLSAARLAALPWRPGSGDRVVIEPAAERPTTYIIAYVTPLDAGDLEIHLTEDSR